MKKYNLFKVIGITIIACWLLTLFIPSSYLDYSGKIVKSGVNSMGIIGILSNFSVSITYFNGIAVFLISVACLYAIANKLDLYNKLVENTANLFNNRKRLLVTISIVIFGLLACVVNDPLILIVFAPFVYQVMKKLEIDNKVILSSTIIASLVGAMNGIYNKSLFGLLKLELNTLLLVKIIVLVLSLAILIFFTAPKKEKKAPAKKQTKKTNTKAETKKTAVKKVSAKKDKVSKDEKMVNKVVYLILTLLFGCIGLNKFYAGKIKSGIVRLIFCWTLVPAVLALVEFIVVLTEKSEDGKIPSTSSRRECASFTTGLVLFIGALIVAIIPWEALINKFEAFTKFNTWLSKLAINKYLIFSNIIGKPVVESATSTSTTGAIAVIGKWALMDAAIFNLVISGVIALCSNIKFNDFIATETKGIKKVLPVAITAMLISIVLIIMVTTGVNITICNWIVSLAEGFNLAALTVSTIIGSVITADFYYFVSTIGPVFTTAFTNTDLYGVIGLVMQSIFYLSMIIAPTSVGLIIGLYYLDIPYGKWFKYIWKVLLALFVVAVLAAVIIFALI